MNHDPKEILRDLLPTLETLLDINKYTQSQLTGDQAAACFDITMKLAAGIVKTRHVLGLSLVREEEREHEG